MTFLNRRRFLQGAVAAVAASGSVTTGRRPQDAPAVITDAELEDGPLAGYELGWGEGRYWLIKDGRIYARSHDACTWTRLNNP